MRLPNGSEVTRETATSRHCPVMHERRRVQQHDVPQIVQTLIAAGFDGYLVDLRQGSVIYYLPDGDLVQLKAAHVAIPWPNDLR